MYLIQDFHWAEAGNLIIVAQTLTSTDMICQTTEGKAEAFHSKVGVSHILVINSVTIATIATKEKTLTSATLCG